jgi:hypothetical protein
MQLFELKDKNNQTTELFKIKNFNNVKDVINKLNKYYNLVIKDESDSFYTEDKEGSFSYVYVANDGFCRFVENLTEFNEGFQTEKDWQVNSSFEVS